MDVNAKFFSYSSKPGHVAIGIETDDGCYDFTTSFEIYQKSKGVKQPLSVQFLQVLIEMGYLSAHLAHEVLNDAWVQSKKNHLVLHKNIHFLPPIARPSKIIGIGRNYAEHAKELQNEIPEEPIFFCKAPSSIIAHQSPITIPGWLDGRVDHEAELAVIIGKEAKDVPGDQALNFVAGYSILNDVTARSLQKTDIENKRPWFRSKSIDTFCPMGPYIVPSDNIPDPQILDILCTVNQIKKQSAKTSSMIFSVAHLISTISRFMTLQPGDVIATGTPEGVSPIRSGDIVEISISGLGKLVNPVVNAAAG